VCACRDVRATCQNDWRLSCSADANLPILGHNRVMVDTEAVTTKRRGRPPASDSAETRRAIFDSARRLFAERGYGEVTNKEVASTAGITTGALYHYVESKLDLYVEVHTDLQDRVYGRFNEAVSASDTFLGKLEGILEAANAMNEEDYTLALFVGTVRTDMRRFPEIRSRLARSVRRRDRFFVDIVDVGVARSRKSRLVCRADPNPADRPNRRWNRLG